MVKVYAFPPLSSAQMASLLQLCYMQYVMLSAGDAD